MAKETNAKAGVAGFRSVFGAGELFQSFFTIGGRCS